jgi:hypothetical protein
VGHVASVLGALYLKVSNLVAKDEELLSAEKIGREEISNGPRLRMGLVVVQFQKWLFGIGRRFAIFCLFCCLLFDSSNA